jgi:hypothetical protein
MDDKEEQRNPELMSAGRSAGVENRCPSKDMARDGNQKNEKGGQKIYSPSLFICHVHRIGAHGGEHL